MVPPRHEARDVGARFAVSAVAVLFVSLAAMILLVTWLYPGTINQRFVPAVLPQAESPALQSSPRADMARFQSAERARLNSLGWVDQASGRVHVPIADAMRRIAADGIPGWPGGAR